MTIEKILKQLTPGKKKRDWSSSES